MANKKNLIATMRSNSVNNNKPFGIIEEDNEPDFNVGFGSQNLDEGDEDMPAPSSIRNQFKIPDPVETQPAPHAMFEIPEEKVEEENVVDINNGNVFGDLQPIEQETSNDLFKIPEIQEEESQEETYIEEDVEIQEDAKDMFKIPEISEPEIKEDKIEIEKPIKEIESSISEIKEEIHPPKTKEVSKKEVSMETLNETDKKILLQIISQTKPNFDNLTFLGEDYLNNLWEKAKELI